MKSFTISLGCLVCFLLSAVSLGAATKKIPPPQLLTIPSATQQQICQRLLNGKSGCTSDVQIIYDRSYKLDNDKNLLFFYLKDKNNRYSMETNIPVTLDNKGAWKVGRPFVGEPKHLARDYSRGLWLHTQYNVEGQLPSILYSKGGYIWKEIALPAKPKAVFSFESISKICITNKEIMITLQAMDKDVNPITTFWKAPLARLATSTNAKQWRPTTSTVLNAPRCSSAPAKNNHWLIQGGETMTLMIHPKNKLTVKIVHDMTTKKRIKQVKSSNLVATNKVSVKSNFAVQIGAYKNMSAVNTFIQQLQKAGFNTFTRVLDSKGGKIKKIYIGPYTSREVATAKQKALKSSFKANKLTQSAFVLKFR